MDAVQVAREGRSIAPSSERRAGDQVSCEMICAHLEAETRMVLSVHVASIQFWRHVLLTCRRRRHKL